MKLFGYSQTLAMVTVAIAGAAMIGCATAKSEASGTCKLATCDAGLSVEIHGARDSDINVKIVAADGQMRSFDCDQTSTACTATFNEYTPENVSVTITKKESNMVRSYALTYHNERPNGEDCPPVCKQAHLDVQM